MKKQILFSSCMAGILVLGLMLFGCPKDAGKEAITIKVPLVTWGGYAALFAANNGPDAKEDSLFYKYGHFKVQLVQEENPANQLQGFANGTYQIIWSTMDMIPLTYDSLSKDSRAVPKVIGLFDYSAGGDGIIVRGSITKAADLKGKKIVTSQYTPSHYFLLWYLDSAGLTQKDANIIFTADAILAKDTFINDKSIDVCVTWSPFIYDITDAKKDTYVKGAALLTTSAKGNPAYGLIADVYLARADLVKDKPEVIAAFTKAMLEGYDMWAKDKKKIAGMTAQFFGLKGGADEVMLMFNDVTIGGKKENSDFFDKNNAFSAYKIFDLATSLYKKNANIIPSSFAVKAEEVIAPEPMRKALGNN